MGMSLYQTETDQLQVILELPSHLFFQMHVLGLRGSLMTRKEPTKTQGKYANIAQYTTLASKDLKPSVKCT